MAVDYLLKINGVDGESKISGHEDEIDVLAWSWGMSQSGTMHVGGGGGAGKVDVQDISLTKYVDKATPTLIKMCCNGKHFDEVLLTARKAGEEALEYFKIKMTAVLVTSINTGGSGGEDRLTENVSLNFAKYEVAYTPQKEDGSGDAEITVTWNIEKNVEE
jgi:type VI secretion system secreted protein Hcp